MSPFQDTCCYAVTLKTMSFDIVSCHVMSYHTCVCYLSGDPNLPLAPRDVQLQVYKCGSAIEVKWQPPLSEGIRGPITAYEIQIKESGWPDTSTTFSHSNRSQVFKGLRVNTAYDIKVRARNEAGSGPWTKKQVQTTASMLLSYFFFKFFLKKENVVSGDRNTAS